MAKKPDREKHTRQDKTRSPDYRGEMWSNPPGPSRSLDLKKIIVTGRAARLKEEKLEAQRRTAEVRTAKRMDIVICPALGSWMETNEIDQTRLKQAVKAIIVEAAVRGDPELLARTKPGMFWAFNLKSARKLERRGPFEIENMPAEIVSWLLKFKHTTRSAVIV